MANPVRKARLDKTWTQRELAETAKVSLATIHKAEKGQKNGELSKNKIAKALDKPVNGLFP